MGYEGELPYLNAVLPVNKHEDERQLQLANIRRVDEVLFKARTGDATLEQLRQAGNPFQHDTAGKLISGRLPYKSKNLSNACTSTAELESLFQAGHPSLAQEIVDTNRDMASLQRKKDNLQELARPECRPQQPYVRDYQHMNSSRNMRGETR